MFSYPLLFLSLILLAHSTTLAQEETFRGGHYCEIIWGGPVTDDGALPDTATVSWNGTGGVCPSNPGYYNLTEEDVKQVHGRQADIVLWNGLRQWTLGAFIPQSVEEEGGGGEGDAVFYEYGTDIFPDGSGLVMRKQATLALTGMERYAPNFVTRNVTALWKADTNVYELVAPNCSSIYVMQSFFMGRPGDWGIQDEKELPTLVESGTIMLPEGWVYRERMLTEDLYVEGTNGVTAVLLDSARNSYSAMDSPIDPSLCPDQDDTSSAASSYIILSQVAVLGAAVLLLLHRTMDS